MKKKRRNMCKTLTRGAHGAGLGPQCKRTKGQNIQIKGKRKSTIGGRTEKGTQPTVKSLTLKNRESQAERAPMRAQNEGKQHKS